MKCWLSTFWHTQMPSLTFSKRAQYCHNWPCKILLYLSQGGGGTDLPRASAVRAVNKITLLMCKHLSNSAHPVAHIQTLVTVQDPGIKTQTRKVEHLIILSLLTGILVFLVLLQDRNTKQPHSVKYYSPQGILNFIHIACPRSPQATLHSRRGLFSVLAA